MTSTMDSPKQPEFDNRGWGIDTGGNARVLLSIETHPGNQADVGIEPQPSLCIAIHWIMRVEHFPLIVLFILLGGCSNIPMSRKVVIEHTLLNGEVRRFPMLVETPRGFNPSRDRAAMLFGGGYQHDLHWSVPGSYEQDGESLLLTVDGQESRDGDTIAAALLDSGIAVVRYGSIHIDDAMHSADPATAEPIGFNDTADLAAKIWATGLDELDIESTRCVAIAHSLGGIRSVHATIGQGQPAGGYVLLAGAYASPTMRSPRRIVSTIDEHQTQAPDYDGSGRLDAFERAAWSAIESGDFRDGSRFKSDGIEYPWLSDELASAIIPVLAIWGSDDPMSYHGPVLKHVFAHANARDQLTTRYFIGRGHSLGKDVDGRIGAIDHRVVDLIVEWVRQSPSDSEEN
jgi:pimeloyl-ACP methyl ester carboxylesterase